MCSICGYIAKKRMKTEDLERMNNAMSHRGPDDSGSVTFAGSGGYTIGMAHRRLAVQDLSRAGRQPMDSPDGRVTVVFNGEIYNFKTLRAGLKEYPFQSQTDTEVLIAAYLEWGISCVHRLNGMFAAALYDRKRETFYLMRDRIGKKPLYYWMAGSGEGNGQFVFASELKGIMNCPWFAQAGALRRDVLSRYLFQQYINAPETIFEDVYKLEPGSILKMHGGNFTVEKYWDPAAVYRKQSACKIKNYREAKDGLKQCLTRAVADRLVADVPAGTFLSGGFDSSLVTALAQEASGRAIRTYSIGFGEAEYDESGYAADIAAYLGTDHTQYIVTGKDMLWLVKELPRFYDEPFADSSQIPTMLVSQLAAKDVTVVLTGDGGDEFFCGYDVYGLVKKAQAYEIPGRIAHSLGRLSLAGNRLEERYPHSIRVIADNRPPDTRTQFVSSRYPDLCRRLVLQKEQIPLRYPWERRYRERDWQKRRMLLDMDTYLPGDILAKVDRGTMAYSLEARCPLLDRRVMEYSFRIPQKYKYRAGNGKLILKDLAYDYIPQQKLDRPKKGFAVPVEKWLRGPLKEQMLSYADEAYLNRQDIFTPVFTSRLVAEYLKYGDRGSGRNISRYMWAFFVFQQWYETYRQYIRIRQDSVTKRAGGMG